MHNRINTLNKGDATKVETHKEIEQELVTLYKDLLSKDIPNRTDKRKHNFQDLQHPLFKL